MNTHTRVAVLEPASPVRQRHPMRARPDVADPMLDAYHDIAQRGETAPAQLAAGLGLPEDEVMGVIAELVSLRLIRQTDTHRFVAVPGGEAIDEVLDEQRRQQLQDVQRLSDGQRKLQALVANRSWLDSGETASVMSTSVGGASPSMFDLDARATESICALHPGGVFDDGLLDRSLARAQEYVKRDLRLRVVHQTSALRHPSMVAYLTELVALGARVRVSDNLPFRMLLADGTTAICTVATSRPYLLRGERLIVLLNRLFETTWTEAQSLERAIAQQPRTPAPVAVAGGETKASPRRLPGLSPMHEKILRLLAEGHTDSSVARVGGITTRTVTRRITEIYALLGVDSRFQAGVAAKQMDIV